LHANGGSLRQLAKASSMPRGAFEGKEKKKKKPLECFAIE
jgi:hypothetical protein